MATTIPSITAITATPPDRSQGQDTFNSNAASTVAQTKTFSEEVAAVVTPMNTLGSEVEAAAASAAAASGATKWTSGETIAEGDARWSPIDIQSYRAINAITSGNNTVDPANDPTDWRRISSAPPFEQTLTDQANIDWDIDLGTVADITLAGNRTFNAPTNLKVETYVLVVNQDATGSRTITWNGVFKWGGGTAPTLSTAANAKDVFSFFSDGTNLYGSYLRGVA